jgi:signal transduction histidine kinase
MHSGDEAKVADLEEQIARLSQENEHLRQELRRIDQDRIEYLQNVSHQLVAPLNAIKWHIENLTSGRIGVERAEKVLRSIYSQSTIAVHLAKNFALMSNLEADHSLKALREPLQPVRILSLLINLADDFQPLGWDKNLTIFIPDETELTHAPDVLAMKPLLSQAFSNVIENAVKYSDVDSEIVVDGTYIEASDVISVTVTNRGISLPEENVDAIFQRGHRTDAAKNLHPAGTGFGLYIARRIIDIHEGVIGATHDDTGRVVFEIVLPTRALEGKGRQRD